MFIRYHAVILLGIAMFACLPSYYYGLGGSDWLHHTLWSQHFLQQFAEGELYPRWLMGMNAGYGSPVFFYYPPMSYWLSAPWYYVFENMQHVLMASITCAVFLSGVAMAWWMQRHVSVHAAFWAAAIYMLAPFHLAYNVYAGLMFSMLWGYVWIPFLLRFGEDILQRKKYAIIAYALVQAALLMTSIHMALIVSWLPLLYMCFTCPMSTWKSHGLQFMAALMLAAGVSAIYWLPVLEYRPFIALQSLWDGGQEEYHYSEHFIFVQMDVARLTVLLMTLALLGFAWWKVGGFTQKHTLFWLGVGLFGVFMSSMLSWLVWELIPLMHIMQFPWRWWVLPTFSLAVIAGYLVDHEKGQYNLLLGCATAFFILAMVYSEQAALYKQHYWQREQGTYHALAIDPTGAYLPRDVNPDLFHTQAGHALLRANHSPVLIKTEAVEGRLLHWKPRDIAFEIMQGDEVRIQIRQHAFPGWQAYVNDVPIDYDVNAHSGAMEIRLPASDAPRKGVFLLEKLYAEQWGRALSFLSFFMCLALVVLRITRIL